MPEPLVEPGALLAAEPPLAAVRRQRGLREYLVRDLRGSAVREAVADEDAPAPSSTGLLDRLALVVAERRTVPEDALPALLPVRPERVGAHLERRELGAWEIDVDDLREPRAQHGERDAAGSAPAREGGKGRGEGDLGAEEAYRLRERSPDAPHVARDALPEADPTLAHEARVRLHHPRAPAEALGEEDERVARRDRAVEAPEAVHPGALRRAPAPARRPRSATRRRRTASH